MSATDRPFSGGTKLKWRDSGSFVDIAGIISIGATNFTPDDVDATELDPYELLATTPAAYVLIKKFVAGFIDLGELPVEANLTGGQYAALFASQLVGEEQFWRIDFRSGYSLCVRGYIKGLGVDAKMSDLVKMPFAIKLSTGVVFALTTDASVTGWGA
jgi:hypothetical protein